MQKISYLFVQQVINCDQLFKCVKNFEDANETCCHLAVVFICVELSFQLLNKLEQSGENKLMAMN